jgi:hypothetical protein
VRTGIGVPAVASEAAAPSVTASSTLTRSPAWSDERLAAAGGVPEEICAELRSSVTLAAKA